MPIDAARDRSAVSEIHIVGKNAHGQEVSDGIFAIGPSGQLVMAKQPLKPGWRPATEDEIVAAEHAESERAHAEEEAKRLSDATARREADERGELERKEADENAERAAAKEAAKPAGPILAHNVTPLEITEREGHVPPPLPPAEGEEG